jgi:hypothetical protein
MLLENSQDAGPSMTLWKVIVFLSGYRVPQGADFRLCTSTAELVLIALLLALWTYMVYPPANIRHPTLLLGRIVHQVASQLNCERFNYAIETLEYGLGLP